MASSSFRPLPRGPIAPGPYGPGAYSFDVRVPQLPICVVTRSFQLPWEFLNPSPHSPLVVGFDCEGIELCHNGSLCVMQLAFPNAIYLVDALFGGLALMNALVHSLLLHGRGLNFVLTLQALYFQFGIKLNNVMDTQIAYTLIEQQEGRMRLSDDKISFVGLLADHRYCGVSYHGKEEIRFFIQQDPTFWSYRPMSDLMVNAAADDVRCLLFVYDRLMERMTERSMWHLQVRGAMYCRCFCIHEYNRAEWPPIPPVPDRLKVGWNPPEDEILVIINVPQGKMGLVIGRRGSSILAIKASCNCEIIIGGDKGPADKVCLIGPTSEVRKAESLEGHDETADTHHRETVSID
ncbi:hypothetical protein V6N11_061424 [Hibiscus sabdariffa]|uniref:K Homology domain-containing protein n=1 Tax=Hibiscus sabdariffa TaxID=183260 RepID=A0ABR2NVP0_9ROSI